MKSGDCRVLIASDVVARGIDIECVTYIINYDVPKNSEMYIHRIGRTGRAGRTGESFTLVCRRDWCKAQDLIKILSHAGQVVPDELIAMAERFKNRIDRGGDFRRGGRGGNQGEYGRGSYSNNYGSRQGMSQGGFGNQGGFGVDSSPREGGRGYGNYPDNREYSDFSSREYNRGGGHGGYGGRGRGRSSYNNY